jgi:hypothetical protein
VTSGQFCGRPITHILPADYALDVDQDRGLARGAHINHSGAASVVVGG